MTISEGGDVRYVFLNIKKELWSRGNDGVSSMAGDTNAESSWPFSIDLPRTITLKHGPQTEYRLPGSFAMRRGRVVINYRAVAYIKYGMFSSVHSYVAWSLLRERHLTSDSVQARTSSIYQ